MKLGNAGGRNKGKKYLKITGQEIIKPENQRKTNEFKEWFDNNYVRMQLELIAKRTYDEDILNDTFLRIHDKILYGGLDIDNYKAYFHRAFYTNYVQESMKKSDAERMLLSDEYAINTIDSALDEIEEQQLKMQLYKNVLLHVKERFNEPDYQLFIAYTRLGSRNYEPLSKHINMPYESVADIIGKIKKSIRKNPQFINARKLM